MKRTLSATALLVALAACGNSGTSQTAGATGGGGAAQSYPVLADSMAVGDIAVFQAVKVTIVSGGSPVVSPNAPVVGGRPALLRAYMNPGADWVPRPLDAELHLSLDGMETAVLQDSKSFASASSEKDLSTTFDFELTGDQVPPGVAFSLIFRDAAVPPDRPEGTIAYPAVGATQSLGAQPNGDDVKIALVPVRYDADGSQRLPDTSPAQLSVYHDTLFKMYPTAKVDITVHDPLPWSQTVGPDGTGWDELMQAVADLRANDNPPSDLYYVAVLAPAPDVDTFCASGCVLGVAPVIGPTDVPDRMAMIVGYTGQMYADTLNQELAHAMGREHAPCGNPDGPDPKFPYKGGRIGVWGYDVLEKKLVDPAGAARDFMSYCDPIWISDYTFAGLFKRVQYVNKFKQRVEGPTLVVRPLYVGRGEPRWGQPRRQEMPLGAAPDAPAISYVDAAGRAVARATARWLPYDHLAGGVLLVPEHEGKYARVRVEQLPGHAAIELARSP